MSHTSVELETLDDSYGNDLPPRDMAAVPAVRSVLDVTDLVDSDSDDTFHYLHSKSPTAIGLRAFMANKKPVQG
jgi:hypothetical protein